MTPFDDAPVLLAGENLTVRAHGQLVLHRVSIAVRAGEIVTVIGRNGSGKSTLLQALLGLIRVAKGRVVRAPRVRIGYTPQHMARDPTLPLTAARFMRLGAEASEKVLKAQLEEVGAADVLDRPLAELSGGELHRVALARALLRRPHLLVLDEPLANVDLAGQAELYALLARLRSERSMGILLVSHDLHLVMAASDHVICLDGHVTCEGTPESVLQHEQFAGIFGAAVARQLARYVHDHNNGHGFTALVEEPAE